MSRDNLAVGQKKTIITHILNYAKKCKQLQSDLKVFEEFLSYYYAHLSIDDLKDRSIEALYGVTYKHWILFSTRKRGNCQVEVFNPTLEKDGWSSAHTVIMMVNDDMPFMIDSMHLAVQRHNLKRHIAVSLGSFRAIKNDKGEIQSVHTVEESGIEEQTEALVYMEVDRIPDAEERKKLELDILDVLKDVRLAVADWQPMLDKLDCAIYEIMHSPVMQEVSEGAAEFLRWMKNDHFTFIGYRQYKLVGGDEDKKLHIQRKSGLGVLRVSDRNKLNKDFSSLPPEARKLIDAKEQCLIISQTNTISTVHVHRRTMRVDVKCYDDSGKVTGLHCFIGLCTSSAYHSRAKDIPLLREKMQAVLDRSGLPPKSHTWNALEHIIDSLPRDDLFQASIPEIQQLAIGILYLQDRHVVRLFVRTDAYERYLSCLIYLPRCNFNTNILHQIESVLLEDFRGKEVSSSTLLTDDTELAHIHCIVRLDPPRLGDIDISKTEKRIAAIAQSWQELLQRELFNQFNDEKVNELMKRYTDAFSVGYQDRFTAKEAINDIIAIEKLLSGDDEIEMMFYRPDGSSQENICFKIFRKRQAAALSDVLPMLENMGLRVIGERPYEVAVKDDALVWVNDFNLLYCSANQFDAHEVAEKFKEAFLKTWNGHTENDGFNRLVLAAQLDWSEIRILRAYCRYLKQVGFALSQEYIEQALFKNTALTQLLLEAFHLRFNPKNTKEYSKTRFKRLEQQIEEKLEDVESLDEDRIIRAYLNVIKATLRTNVFQKDGAGEFKCYVSFKLDSKAVDNMPQPVPMFDAFVHSARFEGVHLRMSKVARGGIRWSDRQEDFRTEVLGLVKAQQVKNSVIVPSGAKGGFILKKLPTTATRDEMYQEGVRCYKNFIRGLLDIIDNLTGKKTIIQPKDVICYDKDDYYFVVAADKGTATFSDFANQVSKEYGYWLDDAFASGGSTGYDHKKMGITAKGAWTSVQHHFKRLGIDVQKESITVLGIGDMAGDVFGNGLLLSQKIKLLAAFNHQHIFIDPDPNTKTSFKERKRLFELSRSSWTDYNPKKISKGGGIFERSAKSISITPQMKKCFDLHKDTLTPNEFIKALLQSKLDLIFNGGIGTFVKASFETQAEAADRANDNIRVNGDQLRCGAISEGGNLGFTQAGRIEFELTRSGLVNTDFIDNSAGVDCSDHEVNIKVLLNEVVMKGQLTEHKRNKLLEGMTNDVAQLVLKSNHAQNQAITLAADQSRLYLGLYQRYINLREAAGVLNRDLEFLPDDKALEERKTHNLGITRPEMAVLLAYSKIYLKGQILDSNLPEDPYFKQFVMYAFPHSLSKVYRKEMDHHRLRREIIATQMSNRIIDDLGPTFLHQIYDETGTEFSEIIKAYAICAEIFNLSELWDEINQLDYTIPSELQDRIRLIAMRLIRRSCRWFIRNRRGGLDVEENVSYFHPQVSAIKKQLSSMLVGEALTSFNLRKKELMMAGVSEKQADSIAGIGSLYSTLNVIEASRLSLVSLSHAAEIYYEIASRLDLDWFKESVNHYPVSDRWSVLARASVKGDLDWQQLELTVAILKANEVPHAEKLDYWMNKNHDKVERWKTQLHNMQDLHTIKFDILSVLMRELMALC